ncbi:TRAP transporter small permease [Limnobaculum zhutongyuii]|uniref:TRAP transporter small permease protein n=1 Tax=Limnobaculum zhutongyuii TaxID=2498113 RepID=A0A411WGZ6_9GAMM|nr:TRAP transporter small permease [Limnobaculum zhutongyuii]QBH95571.1 TRAP transporter small permease [Limnobaculum zhutongyuii]TQS88738.1 TRAP transporter small permease [Limnobaculum zhutongyuii]
MPIEKLKKPIDWFIATFSVVMMVILVICVVWQVFSRFVLNSPSTMTDEIARFSMIWVGLLGAAYTVGLQKHLSIDLFTLNLTGIKRRISNIIINLCICGFSGGVMIWGGYTLLAKVYESGQVSPAMQVPMAYIYIVLPISGIIMVYYSLLFIIDAIVNPGTTEESK